MKESKIEADYKKFNPANKFYKFVSPGVDGVPDRIVMHKIPAAMRKTIAKYIYFIEFKAPGKKLRPGRQERECQSIRNLGFLVEVVDV